MHQFSARQLFVSGPIWHQRKHVKVCENYTNVTAELTSDGDDEISVKTWISEGYIFSFLQTQRVSLVFVELSVLLRLFFSLHTLQPLSQKRMCQDLFRILYLFAVITSFSEQRVSWAESLCLSGFFQFGLCLFSNRRWRWMTELFHLISVSFPINLLRLGCESSPSQLFKLSFHHFMSF